MLDKDLGARTNDEITNLSKQSKSKNKNCLQSPILPFIPVHRVVPDTLHLYSRISDQLVTQLIQILRHKDNVNKQSKNIDIRNCDNLSRFESLLALTLEDTPWKTKR